MVPPCSDRISRVPPYSSLFRSLIRTGLSPTMAGLSKPFRLKSEEHWPRPRSLATTSGVSVDVLSSGYLDVSVPQVRPLAGTLAGGLPHSEIHGSKLVRSSPCLIAAYHVLHRLLAPRHPPNALLSLDHSHYLYSQRSHPWPNAESALAFGKAKCGGATASGSKNQSLQSINNLWCRICSRSLVQSFGSNTSHIIQSA